MATKTPKPFRKPLKEKRYQKKIAKRIFLENDRRFLDEITTTDPEGRIVLARELTDKEKSRVKKLVKQAKKNKGAVQRGKLVLLLVAVTAAVLFNVLFRNVIAERTTERLLERVFEASAEVSGMQFRPLAGSVGFDALVVADAEAPMTNLVELGNGRFAIDLWQAFQGKIVIDDMTVSGLAFGTPREASGALPTGDTTPGPEEERTPLLSADSLGLPDTLDAERFLQENLELLETPDAAEAYAENSRQFVERSQEQLAQIQAQTSSTFAELEQFSQTDFTTVDTLEEALRLYQRSVSLLDETTSAVESVQNQVQQTRNGVDSLISQAQAIPATAADDYERLVALVPDIETDGPAFLRGLIDPIARDALGAWYGRIMTGYDYFQRVSALREPDDQVRNRRGTLINFSTVEYPLFLLNQAYFSSTGTTSIEASVLQVSSDQNLNDAPTTVDYRMANGGSETVIGAVVDLRDDVEISLALNFSTTNAPVEISEVFSAIGFDRFTGSASLSGAFSTGSTTRGSAEIQIADPGFSGSSAPSRVGAFVESAVVSAGTVELMIEFTVDENGAVSLAGTNTNLDEAFGEALQQEIDATVEAFRERLDEELRVYLAGDLSEVSEQVDALTGIDGTAESLLDGALGSRQLAQSLVDQANEQVERIRSQIEAETQQAADEALAPIRERAEEEAENIRDRLPLPGF